MISRKLQLKYEFRNENQQNNLGERNLACELKANIACLLVVYVVDTWVRMVATNVERKLRCLFQV